MLYLLMISSSLILAAYSTYRWRKLGFYLTSPAGACAFLWSFVWLIHYLDIFEYYGVGDRVLLYSFIPVFSIFVGEEIGKRIWRGLPRRRTDVKRLSRYLKANALVTLFFSLAGLVGVFLIFGNPLNEGVGRIIKEARVVDGVGMFRDSPFYPVIQYINVSRAFLYVSFFSLIPLWLNNRKLAIRITFVTVAAALITDMSWGSRTLILDTIILMTVWFAIARPKVGLDRGAKKRVKTWVAALSVFLVLFLGAQKITESTREVANMDVQGVEIPYSLGQLLKYYSSALVCFDQTVDYDQTKTYGLMSFGGILNVMHFLRIYRNADLQVYEVMYEWEVDNPNFADGSSNRGNIYTWARYFYSDFGMLGLALVPMVLGVVAGRAMKRISRNSESDYFDYVVLTVCFYIVARSPIIFPLRTDYIVLGLLMTYVLSWLARQKRERLRLREA